MPKSIGLSGNVSPRFLWSKSTACLAWRRFHIFEGNSINSQNGNKVRVKKDRENGGNSPSYNRIIISKSGNFPLYKQNPRQQPCVQRGGKGKQDGGHSDATTYLLPTLDATAQAPKKYLNLS